MLISHSFDAAHFPVVNLVLVAWVGGVNIAVIGQANHLVAHAVGVAFDLVASGVE